MCRTAVSSSIAFCPNEPSPCRQMTCVSGLAALAPTANGRPTPIVPNGPELSRWPGVEGRDRLAAEIEDLLPVDAQDRVALHEVLDLLAQPQRVDVAVGRVVAAGAGALRRLAVGQLLPPGLEAVGGLARRPRRSAAATPTCSRRRPGCRHCAPSVPSSSASISMRAILASALKRGGAAWPIT